MMQKIFKPNGFFIKLNTGLKTLLLLSAVLLLNSSCVSTQPNDEPPKVRHYRIFFADYDQVLQAARKALIRYPIQTDDSDSGVLETEYIKGTEGFISPGQKRQPTAGLRYQLLFTFIKGKTRGKDSVRVSVQKKIEVQRDFFSDLEEIKSDGLEEEVILYRMNREILIERAILAENKKTSGS